MARPNRHQRRQNTARLFGYDGAFLRWATNEEITDLIGAIEPHYEGRGGQQRMIGYRYRDTRVTEAKHQSSPSLTVRDVYFNAGIPVHLRRGVPTRHSTEHDDGKQSRRVQARVRDWDRLSREVQNKIKRVVSAQQLQAMPQFAGL